MPVRGKGVDLDTYSVAQATATAPVTVNATTSATGNTCLTTGAFTVENPGQFEVIVFAPSLVRGTTNLDIELFDGSTFIQSLAHYTAAVPVIAFMARVLVTLAAGGHTLKVTGFVDAGSGTFNAGAGTTGAIAIASMTVRPA